MRQRSAILQAAIWMSGAIVSFCSMAVAGRAVSIELDTFELMTYRSMIGLTLVLIIGSLTGSLGQITRQSLGLHFLRNIAHFAGQNMWFLLLPLFPWRRCSRLSLHRPFGSRYCPRLSWVSV